MIADQCTAGESGMIACKIAPSTADQILAFEKVTPQLAIACKNSSNDCVVSGPISQLDHFEQVCNRKSIKAKRLDIPYGYHSASMEPIVKPLEGLGRSTTWSNRTIPIASNVHGRILLARDCQSDYFAKHARQPVRFAEAIESISAVEGFKDSIYIEIGPQPTVSPLVKSILASNPCPCYPALKKGVDPWLSLNTILSELFLVNYDVKWREIFTDCEAVTINLPEYPLDGTDFQIAFSEPISENRESTEPSYSETGCTLLPRKNLTLSSSDSYVYETTSTILGPLISGHSVGGTAICPASVYHELVVEAAQVSSLPTQEHVWKVGNMSFAHPLIHDPSGPARKVLVHLSKTKDSITSFQVKITSDLVDNTQSAAYFASTVSLLNPVTTKSRRMREAALIKRQSLYFITTNTHSSFRTKLLYEKNFTRVVRYSQEYQTLKELSISSSNLEGYGTFKLQNGCPVEHFVVPPTFTDTLLHTAGFIANLGIESEEICICSHIDSIEVLYEGLDFGETFTIYCSLFDHVQGSILADAFVLDSTGQTIALCCGMEFKKLRLRSFQKAVQPAVQSQAPILESMDAFPSSGTTRIPSPAEPGTPKLTDESRQEIKTKILDIMSKLCSIQKQDLASASSLVALGIDSLLQIEIASALSKAFPTCTIDQDTVSACDTVRSLEENVISQTFATNGYAMKPSSSDSLLDGSSLVGPRSNAAAILHVSQDKLATPLFCFHDGSGQGGLYGKMGNIGRTVYVFSDPDYATNNLRPLTLNQMARRYAASIAKSHTPSLILGGKLKT